MKFNENRFRVQEIWSGHDLKGKLHDLEHESVQTSHGFCTLPH